MPSYILTWNPKKFDYRDFDDHVRAMRKGRAVQTDWSCGNTKRIQPGDRIWFLRQGTDRGLLGRGSALSTSFDEQHWEDPRQIARYVEIEFSELLPTDQRVPIETLDEQGLGIGWNQIYKSGNSLTDDATAQLEQFWEEHLRSVQWHTV